MRMFKSISKIPYFLLFLSLLQAQPLLSQISGNVTISIAAYSFNTYLSEDGSFLFCIQFSTRQIQILKNNGTGF